MQSIIDQLKLDATRSENLQREELNKLKQSVDNTNEEMKRERQQYDKERASLQDNFSLVGYKCYLYHLTNWRPLHCC